MMMFSKCIDTSFIFTLAHLEEEAGLGPKLYYTAGVKEVRLLF